MRAIATLAAAAFLALPLAGGALAEDGMIAKGDVLGTTMEAVKASLAAKGYEVRKSEMEDGKIEVYFVKDGRMGEVYVDAATGAVSRLKTK